jgi:MFS family permease
MLATLTAAGGLTLPLFGHLLPWQAVFVLVGVPGGLLAVLAFLLYEPHRQPGTVVRADASTWGDFLAFIRREPRLLALHFMSFPMAAMAIYTAAAWMPVFLNRVQHMPILEIGAALGLTAGLSGIVGNLIAGLVSDRVGQSVPDAYYRVSMITCLISVPLGVFMYLAPDGLTTVIAYGLFYATGGAFAGTATASLNVITPEPLRGKAFSCYWLWMAVMGALGPLFAATLTEHLFHDPMAVGRSAAIVVGVTMPVAALCFRFNLKALARVVLGGAAPPRIA